jgi:hypothetical protein
MGFQVRAGIFRRPKLAPASFLKGLLSPPTHIRCSALCVDGRDTSSRLAVRCCPPLASPAAAQAATADDEVLKNRSSSRSAGKATGRQALDLEGLISGAGPSGKLWCGRSGMFFWGSVQTRKEKVGEAWCGSEKSKDRRKARWWS